METNSNQSNSDQNSHIFKGNIIILHAFDVGDDIDLEKLKDSKDLIVQPLTMPKYFRNYHTPLAIDLPHPHTSSRCISTKIHNFGAISFTYQIPFEDTLENIKRELNDIDNIFTEQSVVDVGSVFKRIKQYIAKPKFFQTKSSYLIIQVDPKKDLLTIDELKKQHGGAIASMLRFETETLSEYQKDEILEDALGYFKGDLLVIDPEAAFVYDKEYSEILDFFEFANLQHLELRYFDRLLDQQLNYIYEGKAHLNPHLTSYLPFIGTTWRGPVDDLGRLKVDISVIVERLENSIKLVGETYFTQLYNNLVEKLDLKNLHDGINRKLDIIKDIQTVYQHKIDSTREDLLSVLVIILIAIEVLVAMSKH